MQRETIDITKTDDLDAVMCAGLHALMCREPVFNTGMSRGKRGTLRLRIGEKSYIIRVEEDRPQ